MRKWTSIGFSSIYHLLDQLVGEGLAEVVVEPAPGRGKERRVHHVTAPRSSPSRTMWERCSTTRDRVLTAAHTWLAAVLDDFRTRARLEADR